MDSRFKNIVLFLISFCVIFLFVLLITSDNKRKSSIVVKHSKDNYPIYEVDNEVTLQNNSVWYVLKENTTRDRDVYLISKDKINNEVVDDVDHFVKETYLDALCNSLSVNRDQISESRLLNKDDISNLYDMETFDNNFDKSKYKLLQNNTLVNYIENEKMYSLCDTSFCLNDNTDIRVVIKIAKYFIVDNKKD